jgi:hypothetical protein
MNIKFKYRFVVLFAALNLILTEMVAAQEQATVEIESSSSASSLANRYYTTVPDYKLKDPTQYNVNLDKYYENVEYYRDDQSYLSVFGNHSVSPYYNNYNFYIYDTPYHYRHNRPKHNPPHYGSHHHHKRPTPHKRSGHHHKPAPR